MRYGQQPYAQGYGQQPFVSPRQGFGMNYGQQWQMGAPSIAPTQYYNRCQHCGRPLSGFSSSCGACGWQRPSFQSAPVPALAPAPVAPPIDPDIAYQLQLEDLREKKMERKDKEVKAATRAAELEKALNEKFLFEKAVPGRQPQDRNPPRPRAHEQQARGSRGSNRARGEQQPRGSLAVVLRQEPCRTGGSPEASQGGQSFRSRGRLFPPTSRRDKTWQRSIKR
ncbi:MAG: hypothetical protein L6R40_008104, partial [Gallowayella cf. fulva]